MEEKKKNNTWLILLLVLIILGLTGYVVYDKALSKEKVPTKEINVEVTPKEDNTTNTLTQVRTYRFFGNSEGKTPDMYTTLKLYSDGKYDFFVNNCEGVTKFSGDYIETNDSISLSGEITKLTNGDNFKKKDNGNSLDFDFSKIACSDSGGIFALESYMLRDRDKEKEELQN